MKFYVFFSLYSLSTVDYDKIAMETLDSLVEFFEDLPETSSVCGEDYDIIFGVSIVTFSSSTIHHFKILIPDFKL